MLYPLYKNMTMLMKPLVSSHIQKRLEASKEDPHRIQERYGRATKPRPSGPLIWFHAASVGEARSILPLIPLILKLHERFEILVTTGTMASAQMMEKELPQRCRHQYNPFDVTEWVHGFLDHWRPQLALWVESELWPNLLKQTKAWGIPIILLNGRLSDRSYERWQWGRFIIGDLLACFDLCMAQSPEDQKKLEALGAAPVVCPGNLKYASPPLDYDPGVYASLAKTLSGRRLWVAASTHEGEETHILKVHKNLKKEFPDLLTILIPRHPARTPEILERIRKEGLYWSQRSGNQQIAASTELYVVDTWGELGVFFKLAPMVFIGGSLVPVGGHNIIEPAHFQCAILHGPHMFKCRDIAETFKTQQAAISVETEQDLVGHLRALLQDEALCVAYQQKAKTLAEAHGKVMETIVQDLMPYLRGVAQYDRQRTSLLV